MKTCYLIFFLAIGFHFAAAAQPRERTPVHRNERVLVASDAKNAQNYLAFPDVLDLGDEVLVAFKRGQRHADDVGAVIDSIRIDKRQDRVVSSQVLAQVDNRIMQMGDWVRYPNGDIGLYVDVQTIDGGRNRTGMVGTRSTDGGRTFPKVEKVGLIEGVEYGYPFEFIVEGTTTWMLVMTFSNLPGGYSVYEPRPQAGQVSVLRSDDSGRNWSLVRNLSREFGNLPINESSFVRYADGFLVITRGYDNRARLHSTDNDFRVRQQLDLTETYGFIESYVGRPRLFMRDGAFYLIGRNWTQRTDAPSAKPDDGVPFFPTAMKMCLFRLDPQTLAVASYSILDNANGANVTDAYYPVPYFIQKEGKTYFRVVDYKGLDRRPPQIVEFEYLWDEVR